MDEIDIDGEDYNELEARLYGQIHHEAVVETTAEVVNNTTATPTDSSGQNSEGVERIVTARSVVNRPANSSRVPDTRYWAKGLKKSGININNNPNQNKNINSKEKILIKEASLEPKDTALEKQTNVVGKQNVAKNETSGNIVEQQQNEQPQEKQQDEEGEKEAEEEENVPEDTIGSQLLINPAALIKNAKGKQNKKKKTKTNQSHVPRSGPFQQQETKLQKALIVQAKKQKSKKVREKKRKGILRANETIVLDSSTDDESHDESGNENCAAVADEDDDVVVLPPQPPPLITLSDSDNEQNDNTERDDTLNLQEENAMDASDVVMDNKSQTKDFTKPVEVRSNAAATDKRNEQASSRCTSPSSSVLSSDDFIGPSDRCRLLADNCMADDQDLALLTADVDSLMQPPTVAKAKAKNKTKKTAAATSNNHASDDVICTAEFIAPLTALNAKTVTTKANVAEETPNKQQPQNDYRVEQAEFRALDVYESESDINDSVYTKGGTARRATTIINAVGSSSEADDVQQRPTSLKIKRFSKRRSTSSNNPKCDTDEDDGDGDDDDGVAKTSVPYIMRGTAVERCNKKLRKRTQSLSGRRGSAGGKSNATGTLTDTEFIATLNSLVQGYNNTATITNTAGDEGNENDDENDEVQTDNEDAARRANVNNEHEIQLPSSKSSITTAIPEQREVKREPDEISVASVQIIERPPPPAFLSEAVPDEAMTGLDSIFASIDNMSEQTNLKQSTNYDNSSSDDEPEVITPPVTTTTKTVDTVTETESANIKDKLPIRHVVYSERGGSQLTGIGWNDEMIKFYNLSWHGEHFSLIGVHNKMEKDRDLWKINTEDRFPTKRPYSNLKCYNCCEFGHTRAKCTRPKKPLICYMCGESGHLEPRCPNTICLRCGNKTQVFTRTCNACTFQNRLICPICKVRGHAINLCPDKWRRYHSTTQPNAHPNSQIELNRRKVCCACGGVGHFSDTCRNPARFAEYPVIVPHVKSHQKSYADLLFKTPRIGIAFNLLYRPGDRYVFHMAEKAQPNDYYARFLKAVGLENLVVVSRKRPGNSLADEPVKPSKQAKSYKGAYKPNPYGNVARAEAESTTVNVGEDEEEQPNQVQEVSGSVNASEIDNGRGVSESVTSAGGGVGNAFKAPNEVTVAATTSAKSTNLPMDSDSNYSFSDHFEMPPTAPPAPSISDDVNMENVGEDEAAADDDEQPSTSAAAASRIREMEPLPDYIPLGGDNSDTNVSDLVDNFDVQTGISRRFVAANTDDENDDDDDDADAGANANQTSGGDLPCEAKIYLTHFHSNYLLSPDGHAFLVQKSKECNIKARLDWTSVGHVLVIFGLPKQQDIFHKALLEKCHELMEQMNSKQQTAIKVPKRIDALIRFLRDNISQLQSDLGDVNDLQRRIKNLERTHTKANMKLAEKCRRLLNMILLGQAGLCDGDKHLDKLLFNLKSLINDYQAENVVPQSLREEIDSHAKVIFTSYRHNNYPELIQAYNRLPKNQKCGKNIDPLLLGQKMLDVTLTAEQRARLEQGAGGVGGGGAGLQGLSTTAVVATPAFAAHAQQSQNQLRMPNKKNSPDGNYIFNSPNPAKSAKILSKQNRTPNIATQAQVPTAAAPAAAAGTNTYNNNNMSNSTYKLPVNTAPPMKRQYVAQQPPLSAPSFLNPQQKSTVVTKFQENMLQPQQQQQQYGFGIGHYRSGGGGNQGQKTPGYGAGIGSDKRGGPSQGPSVFWSRESMRYLDECIQMAESNRDLLQKLQRIQTKSLEGALSYNDYRAVIKLHGAMVGN